MVELIEPSEAWSDVYLAAEAGFVAGTERSAVHRGDGESFEDYLDRVRAWARGEQLPDGWVPMTVLWLVDDDDWIGRVTMRQGLSDQLRTWGGHIGYEIHPAHRRRGYGTEALRLALMRAAAMGIDPSLVTCFADNVASRRIIERNGGELEAEFIHEDRPALRYWVPAPRS